MTERAKLGESARQQRQKRLAEALKVNLKRRKAQQRERATSLQSEAARGETKTAKESG